MAPQPASDPDVLDCRLSVNLSAWRTRGILGIPQTPWTTTRWKIALEDSFGPSYEPEEAPMMGEALPQELMTQVADIFRRHLVFEEPETQPQKAGRVSKLTATGKASSKPKTTMPNDATCYDRFEAIADKNRWTAFPAKADRAVRAPDEAWRALFKCPTIPQEAKERLKAEQGASSSNVFRTPAQRKLEELLVEVDTAARSGMKFASVLMLSAEVLMRHHQQLPEDDSQVFRDEAGHLLLLLGPLVRLAYYQFARVSTRSVKAHRENIKIVHKNAPCPPKAGLDRKRKKVPTVSNPDNQFLRAILDFSAGVARPSGERITAVRTTKQHVISHQESPTVTWLRALGLMASLVDVG
ncbi:hypothetical protein BSL78_11362 [Apostichopus japonicus]|uniref:Uncharacterized protein n=1 Tax=Stichopus japonicus TaxID=307972 RepID=A0A2G8KUX4_STIJA|nr:hypothetical protein BSL78_11362 [Apostichopus japonicus]